MVALINQSIPVLGLERRTQSQSGGDGSQYFLFCSRPHRTILRRDRLEVEQNKEM